MPADKQPKEADVSKVLTPKAPVKDETEAIQDIVQNLKSKAFLALIMRAVMALHPGFVQADVIQAIENSLGNDKETTQIAQDLEDEGIGDTDDIKKDTGQDIASHNLENQGLSPQQAQQAVDASELPAAAPPAMPKAAQKQAEAVESAGAGAEGAEMPQPEVAPEKEEDRARELREQQEQAKKRPEETKKEEAKPEGEKPSEEKVTEEQPKIEGEKPAAQPEVEPTEEAQVPVEEEEATVPTEEAQVPVEEEEAGPAETVEPGVEPEAGAQLGAEKVAAKGAETAVEGGVEAAGEAAGEELIVGAGEAAVGAGGWVLLAVIIIFMLIPGVMLLVGWAMLAFNDWISKKLTNMIMQLTGALSKIPGAGKIAGKLGLDKAKEGLKGSVSIAVYAIGIMLVLLGSAYLAIIVHLGSMTIWDWTWAWVTS